MKRPVKIWTQHRLAKLIGLRVLGKDFDYIAKHLDCSVGEAKGMMKAAREMLRCDRWMAEFLTDEDHRRIEERDVVQPKAAVLRPVRIVADVPLHRPPADVTAQLMGDPDPDRRTRIASQEV